MYNFLTITKSVNDQPKLESDNLASSLGSFVFYFEQKILKHLELVEVENTVVKKFQKFLGQIETKNGADYDQVLFFDPEFVDHDKHKQLVVCIV